MTGIINRNGVLARNNTSGSNIALYGGLTNYNTGGSLFLYDKSTSNTGGNFALYAGDGTNVVGLVGKPDGTLTWGIKNIVRSVVSASGTADANGNISQGTLFTG